MLINFKTILTLGTDYGSSVNSIATTEDRVHSSVEKGIKISLAQFQSLW